MNNYILAELYKNSFRIASSGTIFNKDFTSTLFKIDTGCSYSTIPLRKLLVFNDSTLKELKKSDIVNSVCSMETYGVESGGTKHKKPVTFDERMSCTALKFKHTLTNFSMGGYKMPDTDVFVNYDRHGNILIGMDILSLFDIHMGVSSLTGKCTFIGVLKTQEDKSDYNNALYKHFNIVESNSILAEGFRKVWEK